ncbi:MAG: hypothetical protein ACQETH_13505 [Candidatus Rifleibacteriota bacterium]
MIEHQTQSNLMHLAFAHGWAYTRGAQEGRESYKNLLCKIFCQKDLEKFRKNKIYPQVFADYLQAEFSEVELAMREFFEGKGDFNLKEFGHMVV